MIYYVDDIVVDLFTFFSTLIITWNIPIRGVYLIFFCKQIMFVLIHGLWRCHECFLWKKTAFYPIQLFPSVKFFFFKGPGLIR